MTPFVQIALFFAPAACIGMALAALAVHWLKRDPGITIERGAPRY